MIRTSAPATLLRQPVIHTGRRRLQAEPLPRPADQISRAMGRPRHSRSGKAPADAFRGLREIRRPKCSSQEAGISSGGVSELTRAHYLKANTRQLIATFEHEWNWIP